MTSITPLSAKISWQILNNDTDPLAGHIRESDTSLETILFLYSVQDLKDFEKHKLSVYTCFRNEVDFLFVDLFE